MLYISFVSEYSLTERSGVLESRMSDQGQSDAHEIMSTLDTKQNPNRYLENSQGERKNFPTISVHIPHEGQSRDASSEVCVNQWVYMHWVLLILYLCHVNDTLYMWGHFSPIFESCFTQIKTVGISNLCFSLCSISTCKVPDQESKNLFAGQSAIWPNSFILITDYKCTVSSTIPIKLHTQCLFRVFRCRNKLSITNSLLVIECRL